MEFQLSQLYATADHCVVVTKLVGPENMKFLMAKIAKEAGVKENSTEVSTNDDDSSNDNSTKKKFKPQDKKRKRDFKDKDDHNKDKKPRDTSSTTGGDTCFCCGNSGHLAKDCRFSTHPWADPQRFINYEG
jgi:hypothetical protein